MFYHVNLACYLSSTETSQYIVDYELRCFPKMNQWEIDDLLGHLFNSNVSLKCFKA